MSEKKNKCNVEKLLELLMPSVLDLIGKQRISWNAINSGLEKHLLKIREDIDLSDTGEILKDTTFYSFLIGSINGNSKTEPMFDFFNKTFNELKERLSKDEVVHLHKMIKTVLTNFDYKYINFIGELATLNAYKSTEDYTLLNIEEIIYNDERNTRADLLLKRNNDNVLFLVEIVNVHLENRKLNNKDLITKFVDGKIKEKLKKTFFENPKYELYLQVVIWIDNIKQVEILSEIFNKRKKKNIFIPMCYLTYVDKYGEFEHRFEYVNTILID